MQETGTNAAGNSTATSNVSAAVQAASAGFDPSITSTNFGITNLVLQNNNMNITPWVSSGAGAAGAPTVSTISDTLPDGTTGNVTRIVMPSVPGSGTNGSSVSQPFANGVFNGKGLSGGLWVKVTAGTGPFWFNLQSSSGVFDRVSISTSDNLWHLYTISIPAGTMPVTDTNGFEIGVNQFDSGQTGASAGATFETTGAFLADGNDWKVLTYPNLKAGAPIATTTAVHTGVITAPLPTHMLFRLASALVPDVANPILSEAPSEPWRSGGVSMPYTQNPQLQTGGFFWAPSNCTSATNEPLWLSFCLWKSADGQSGWTEDTTIGAGYLKAFGSASDYSTPGTGGGASKYNFKPAFLPFGCNVSGTPHSFCILYSAIKTDTTGTLFLGWSDTINSQYTMLGCSTSTPCTGQAAVTLTGLPLGYAQPSLVSIQNVGGSTGTNYIYVNMQGPANGPFTIILTTPANPATAGAGTTLTYYQMGLVPYVNGVDWEYADGTSVYRDSNVFKNHCGYYEYWWTAVNQNGAGPFNPKLQQIATAISPNIDGPWYRYPGGPFIPATSSLYGGTIALGGSNVGENGTNFIWNGNYDDGATKSRGVRALAPLGTCP